VYAEPASLDEFSDWILRRGRSPATATLYVSLVRSSSRDGVVLTDRLIDRDLAPNTRRANMAALSAWAKFRSDHELAAILSDLRLPPGRKQTEKVAFDRAEWSRFLAAIDRAPTRKPVMPAVAKLIALRGFRVGDVLRLSWRRCSRAIETGQLHYEAKGGRTIAWSIETFKEPLKEFAERPRFPSIASLVCQGDFRSARRSVERFFQRVAWEADIPPSSVSPHRLRRTYAWHFLRAMGGDVVALKEHMGWASVGTAMEYVDQSRARELDAVAATVVPR